MRRWVGFLATFVGSALLAGCVSVEIGASDTPGITYFVLDDARPAVGSSSAGAKGALAVHGVGTDPLTDSTAIVYSRRAGERGLYQLAAWTERPTRRLVQLAQQRLESRGAFSSVTQLGQPLPADWLLTLAVEQMFHDVSSTPGRAHLVLRANLIDRRAGERGQVAAARFSAAPEVAEATAAAAAKAFAAATADVLDQLAAWVEATTHSRSVR